MMPVRIHRRAAWIVSLCALCGCSQMPGRAHLAADITPQRQARQQAVERDFEQQRDQAHYHAAVASWEQGDFGGCHKSLQTLLERNPEHVEGNFLLAELYFLNQQPKEACEILERLVQQRPDAAAIHHTYGMVLESLGDRTGAIKHARQAAHLEPGRASYRDCLIALGDAGNKDSPSRLAGYSSPATGGTEPISTTPEPSNGKRSNRSIEAISEFSAALARKDQNRAKSILLRAARDARTDEGGLIALAVAALRQDQPSWAIQVLRTYQSPDSASAAYRRALGTAYYHSGDYTAAEAQLRQSLILDNRSALSYFLLGCILSRQQRQAEAETHLRQAALLDSRFGLAAVLQ